MSTDPNLEKRKDIVTKQLKKRDDERLAGQHKRNEEKKSDEVEMETLEFFQAKFSVQKHLVENKIDVVSSETDKLTEIFDEISSDLKVLQKIVTDSALFITSYELQKAQASVSLLQANADKKRLELIPKKKFAFRSKKKVTQDKKVDVKPITKMVPDICKKNECNISELQDTIITKTDADMSNKDISLYALTKCTVKLLGSSGAMHVNKLEDCTILSGPVSGSIFIEDCKNCIFVLSCQQLRIHSTYESEFYIHVTSKAIIEDSNTLLFAPYSFTYDDLKKHYTQSGLDVSTNNWDDVDDFNWLVSKEHSPNWTVMDENSRKTFNT